MWDILKVFRSLVFNEAYNSTHSNSSYSWCFVKLLVQLSKVPFHLLCFLLAHLLFHGLLAGQVDNMFHREADLLAVIFVELHMNSIELIYILLLIHPVLQSVSSVLHIFHLSSLCHWEQSVPSISGLTSVEKDSNFVMTWSYMSLRAKMCTFGSSTRCISGLVTSFPIIPKAQKHTGNIFSFMSFIAVKSLPGYIQSFSKNSRMFSLW